jgi:hypothetical protein
VEICKQITILLLLLLHEKNVSFDVCTVKVELLTKIKSCANACNKYIFDDLTNKPGHVVERLPPYHCILNPIDLVWSQVKCYIARHKFGLATSALSQITSQRWETAIDHVIMEEGRMWELHGLANKVVDRLVINIGGAETSSDEELLCSDTDSDMESIHPLLDSNYIITDVSK